ncbi:class I SAM-dependent methyltransferase [Pedococcus sp. KACC 23699]|uniref:Class I SAM-dependent methyltransferase n=1 Tax=Pedococcus sp. KACC 23699 TaxID=3149228 RepID=A0AAU7JT14_9MICO
MTQEHGRASAGWLALREAADAAARSTELVDELRRQLPRDGLVVHDLGCGTGSMARWLAVRLSGPQHWVLVDRDVELLAVAAGSAPQRSLAGAPVTVETRHKDVTRLPPHELGQAGLVTASALLDMMTGMELDRFVATVAGARCPALIALSVTGHVDLEPPDRLDVRVAEAFNAHQRRSVEGHRLLGPDAVGRAVDAFTELGREVVVRPSPWLLGPGQQDLQQQWLAGWLRAAREQDPRLTAEADAYARRRLAESAEGVLRVTVHHQDVLVRP